MPLTPEDVSNKRFTPVRLREGYDMGEVDQFLDEVEAELDRMVAENNDLRAKLAAAQDGHAGNGAIAMPAGKVPEQAAETVAGEPADKIDLEKVADVPAAVTAPREEIKVVTSAEASKAALRLLELATNNADAVVAEAKEEAVQIVGTARTEAQRLESETRANAERLESETKARTDQLEEEARTRAGNLDSETEAKRAELLGDTQREKARLDGEVETLRAFEREYRSRLRSYFTEQLRSLDSSLVEGGEDPNTDDADAPKRLRSILDGVGADEAESGSADAPEGAAQVSDESSNEAQDVAQDEAQGDQPQGEDLEQSRS